MFQDVDRIVLDKTGTITQGEPRVGSVISVNGADEAEVLRLAAAVENLSEHPLGKAVVKEAQERGLPIPEVRDFQGHTGKGIEGRVGKASILVGKLGFLETRGVELGQVEIAEFEEKGQTVVGVAQNGLLIGLLTISDKIKDDAAEAVAALKEIGIEPIMVTGDNERTALAVANEVGIEKVMAEVLPGDKAEKVRELQGEGHRVVMVGDGINDAPALMQADIGIAIGAGTDIAIESSDIILMGDRLTRVVDAYQIGRNSYRKTKQNLLLAFSFNGIGVPLAATGLVHPIWAMVAMVLSVSAVLANSFGGRLVKQIGVKKGAALAAERITQADLSRGERMPSIEFAVKGMHCDGCRRTLEDGLRSRQGVIGARVDLERELVTVEYDDKRISVKDLRETVRTAGLQVA